MHLVGKLQHQAKFGKETLFCSMALNYTREKRRRDVDLKKWCVQTLRCFDSFPCAQPACTKKDRQPGVARQSPRPDRQTHIRPDTADTGLVCLAIEFCHHDSCPPYSDYVNNIQAEGDAGVG